MKHTSMKVSVFRGEGFVHYGHFAFNGLGSSSGADVQNFCCEKLKIFLKLLCVRTKRGLRQCGHFADKGGGGG